MTSGGQYVWGVNDTIPAGSAFNSWHYSVTVPAQTYTFGWYGSGADMESVSLKFAVDSCRNVPYENAYFVSIADIYIDYIEQSTGAQKSQLARTVNLSGVYMEQIMIHNIRLGSLASNVRTRVVMRNGGIRVYNNYQSNSAKIFAE